MKRLSVAIFLLLASFVTAEAAARFAVCTTACTWNNVSTAMWSTTSGGATGASPPVAGDGVTLDGATCVGGTTCTITVAADLAMSVLVMGACTAATTGCILDFSINNNNITFNASGQANALNISGTGTRTLKMGNGTWTFASASGTTVINAGTTTNLTFAANSSSIVTNMTNSVSAAGLDGSTLTFNNITMNANSNKGSFTVNAGAISTLTVNGFNRLIFGQASLSIGTWTMTGTGTNPVSVTGCCENGNTIVTMTNISTSTWVGMRGISCAGTGAASPFNNSLNEGTNGCTVSAPNAGTSACILGGWLLWRDMPEHINDNFPAWLEKAA